MTYGNYAYAVLTAGAMRHPNRVAVTFNGVENVTYEELDLRVNQRANAMSDIGVRVHDRVAVYIQDPLEITVTYLALAKIGATLVTLNPYWDLDTTTVLVNRSQCRVLVFDATGDEMVTSVRGSLEPVELVARLGGGAEGAVDLQEATQRASTAAPVLRGSRDDELALFFTSGSTGLPKAVVHTHASAIAVAQQWFDVPHDDGSAFGTGPIIWGVGYFAIAGPALFAGMRLVLENDFNPKHFAKVAHDRGITHISVIPSFFAELFSTDEHEGADLSSVKVILLGGEPLLPSMRERILARFPGVALCSYYGQTEGPYSVIGRQDDGSQAIRASGRARTGGAVAVVDAEGRRLVGEVGEVRLAGPHVMAGYDGDPERTAEVLKDGWYVGGDVGILDESGVLTVMGRRDDAITRGGKFVLPSEIEEAAMEIADVAEAGAVGVVGRTGDPQILLAVQLREAGSMTEDALRETLARALAPAARPDVVVIAEELPHANDASGGRGKLLRREIRARWGGLVT